MDVFSNLRDDGKRMRNYLRRYLSIYASIKKEPLLPY